MKCPNCDEECIIDELPDGTFPVWYCQTCRKYYDWWLE